jgi:ABC-type dipeptide/oligopeptide/nickel transport system ATPase component
MRKPDRAEPILEVRNLSVTFTVKGREVSILNDLSFSLGHRETLGMVGNSGSGKSVTALSILKLLPTPPLQKMSGEIRYRGRNLLPLSNRGIRAIRGKEIAFIFQEPMTALNPVLSIGDQIIEMIRAHKGGLKREARDQGIELLREVGMPGPELRMRNYPHELSGGMRQRATIAMALSCTPSILIADEPTTALDVTIQAQILELFRKLKEERQMSILFITHDLGVIAEIADEVLVIHEGRGVESGHVENIFHAPAHPHTQEILSLLPKRNHHVAA